MSKGFIYCRTRSDYRVGESTYHYPNFRLEFVNGVRKKIEVEPVFPSLASEHSVSMNALVNSNRPSRPARIMCDAVDVKENIDKLS